MEVTSPAPLSLSEQIASTKDALLLIENAHHHLCKAVNDLAQKIQELEEKRIKELDATLTFLLDDLSHSQAEEDLRLMHLETRVNELEEKTR